MMSNSHQSLSKMTGKWNKSIHVHRQSIIVPGTVVVDC